MFGCEEVACTESDKHKDMEREREREGERERCDHEPILLYCTPGWHVRLGLRKHYHEQCCLCLSVFTPSHLSLRLVEFFYQLFDTWPVQETVGWRCKVKVSFDESLCVRFGRQYEERGIKLWKRCVAKSEDA